MQWTKQEEEKLIQMYINKNTIEEISIELNRSPRGVRTKAYRLQITNPKNYTEEETNYIVENYKSYNLQEIADKLGRPKTNICRYVKELGLERTGRKKEITKGTMFEDGVWRKHGWERKTEEERSKIRSEVSLKSHEENPQLAKNISERMKKWYADNPHPKGMQGKKHSIEFLKQMSERVKQYFKDVTPEKLEQRRVKSIETKIKNNTLDSNKGRSNPYSRTKSGKRKDLNNVFMRSAWEANIARYFNYNNVVWEFEPKLFVFKDLKRGCVSYTPDFYLPELGIWVEVKGWMDDKSRIKLERFSRYYPEESEKLWLIDSKEYKIIEKKYKNLIDEWE